MNSSEQFFTIQQVSQKCDVPKSTLRFWEKKFMDILAPGRSHGGQRRYSVQHLAIISRIKQLKEEGMSLQAIMETIHMESGGRDLGPMAKVEIFAERVASLVKMEVRRVLVEALNADR